jgi:hypothetical protein
MLFIAATLPDYYNHYSVYHGLINTISQFEWAIFLGTLMAGLLLSGVLGLIKFNKVPYLFRLLGINILFDTLFLIFIAYKGIPIFFDGKRDYELLASEYKIKAESDIKNGLIIHETLGFPIPHSAGQAEEDRIDSLMNTYGLARRNMGCMVSGPLLRAQSEYEVLTEPYLDQRNGKDWKRRMNKQIEEIRKK